MNGETELRAAVRGALVGLALNGVFDAAPSRGRVPYAVIEPVLGADWGTKDRRGRELRIGVTIIDEGDGPGRIEGLGAAMQDAVLAMPRDLGGWRVAGVMLLRARTAEAGVGRWRATGEFRVRMMEDL